MSRFLGRRPSLVKARFRQHRISDLVTCAVVEAELRFGAAKTADPVRALTLIESLLEDIRVLPFDSAAAKEYGALRARLERAGAMIGPNDLMIASIALANGLVLVTHNAAEFARVPGLQTEDWEI